MDTQHPAVKDVYPFNWLQEPALTFTKLNEDEIASELRRYEDNDVGSPVNSAVSVTSVQPSPSETFPNEDRYDISFFPLPNHPQALAANLYVMLDGHAGPDCSDYAVVALPPRVQQSVQQLPAEVWTGRFSSDDDVSRCLAAAIKDFDDHLIGSVTALFGGTEKSLKALSDAEVQAIIDKPENHTAAVRAQKGATALVVLTVGRHIWSAYIGDCTAVVGIKSAQAGWQAKPLYSGLHNGASNKTEKAAIEGAHPLEPEVMAHNRVLGLIAVTRALGDAMFKMPAIWQARVWNLLPARNYAKMQQLLERNKTPPYMTALAETVHYEIPADSQRACLLVATDGLNNPEIALADSQPYYEERLWIRTLGAILDRGADGQTLNTASQLLRNLWGNGDSGEILASAFLTLDYKHDHYMDDTTLIVAELKL